MRRPNYFLGAGAALALLWALLAGLTPAMAQAPGGALVPPGETPDLLLFYTGDVIGYLTPCG